MSQTNQGAAMVRPPTTILSRRFKAVKCYRCKLWKKKCTYGGRQLTTAGEWEQGLGCDQCTGPGFTEDSENQRNGSGNIPRSGEPFEYHCGGSAPFLGKIVDTVRTVRRPRRASNPVRLPLSSPPSTATSSSLTFRSGGPPRPRDLHDSQTSITASVPNANRGYSLGPGDKIARESSAAMNRNFREFEWVPYAPTKDNGGCASRRKTSKRHAERLVKDSDQVNEARETTNQINDDDTAISAVIERKSYPSGVPSPVTFLSQKHFDLDVSSELPRDADKPRSYIHRNLSSQPVNSAFEKMLRQIQAGLKDAQTAIMRSQAGEVLELKDFDAVLTPLQDLVKKCESFRALYVSKTKMKTRATHVSGCHRIDRESIQNFSTEPMFFGVAAIPSGPNVAAVYPGSGIIQQSCEGWALATAPSHYPLEPQSCGADWHEGYGAWDPKYLDPNAPLDAFGNSGLHLAVYHALKVQFAAMMDRLHLWQRHVEEENLHGETPLIIAVVRNHRPFAAALISRFGALPDGDPTRPRVTTALRRAVEFGHVDMVELLISKNANKYIQGWCDTESPYDFAINTHNLDPEIKRHLGCPVENGAYHGSSMGAQVGFSRITTYGE